MGKILLESHLHPKYPRLHLQLRSNSRYWQGLTSIDGKKVLKSLKTTDLKTALKLGEDFYKKVLRASVHDARQHPLDRLAVDPTVSEVFKAYRSTLPKSKREYADMKWSTIQDFWRTLVVTEITTRTFRDFYAWRRRMKTRTGETVKNHSIHKDMMVIRQTLKYAIEEGHITALPIIPKVGKIESNPRPWLSRDEWSLLAAVSAKRIGEATGNRKLQKQRQDLDDFIMFLVESMMRVGELRELTVGQVTVVKEQKGKHSAHLLIDVHGKRGHRTAIAGEEAVEIYTRRSKGLKVTDLLFPVGQRDAFRELLIAAKLRTDAFGNERNLKSLRATSISLRILAQAADGGTPNLLMIARNAGTSVAMIDNFYARRLSSEMFGNELTKSVALLG
jgi:integrase